MAMTDKEKKKRWQAFTNWYKSTIVPDRPIPAELKKRYMANDGAWDIQRALVWIRKNDPNYLKSALATKRMDAIRSLYEKAYGFKINWSKPANKKIIESFAKAKPYINLTQRLNQIFMKRILPSAQFKKENPYFRQWLNRNQQVYGTGNIIRALDAYNNHKEELADFWGQFSTDPMPKDILNEALKNDWAPNSLAFRTAIMNSDEWAKTADYTDRARQFDENWQSIFGPSVPMDIEMRETFARSPEGSSFKDFFHSTIKFSKVFRDNVPEYTEWERGRLAGGSETELSAVDIFDFFKMRNDFVELWHQEYGGDILPDYDIISQALVNNWGRALFTNKIRALPEYTQTGTGKEKAAKFDAYWGSLFGSTPTDMNLRSRFISSELNDPSAYWDDIKQTKTFRQHFSNWDVYSEAMGGTGTEVSSDPQAYKQYQTALKTVFADAGMELPEELERSIFSSGVGESEIRSHTVDYQTTKGAYERQTGQPADLHTTIIGGTAGGQMRERMLKALERQKAFQESKLIGTQEQDTTTGLVTQKI